MPSWILAEIFCKGIPAIIPTIIDVISSAIKAFSLNLSTINRSNVTPATTIRIIYGADIITGSRFKVQGSRFKVNSPFEGGRGM